MSKSLTVEELREAALQAAVETLTKHFSAVQILATYEQDDGNAVAYQQGTGNFYARIGLAREFLIADKARTEQYTINEEGLSG